MKKTAEAFLKQLGIIEVQNASVQMQKIAQKTKGFEQISRHIIALNDHLEHLSGFVGLSNSNDYLKIKCTDAFSKDGLNEFHKRVEQWASKHKIDIERVPSKDVYYILGKGE